MRYLSRADMTSVLESIRVLHSDISPATLGKRTLDAVLSLIPNEMTAFDGFDQETGYQNSYWYSPPGTVSEQQIGVFAALIHEHPYYLKGISTDGERTFRVSDYMPLKEFHNLAVYNEFYRDFGGDTQISCAMSIAPKSVVTCSLLRPKLDFSDREYSLLKLITPHLAAAFRNTNAFGAIDNERSLLSDTAEKGVIVLREACKIFFISRRAVRLLETYMPGFRRDELPAQLRDFVSEQAKKRVAAEYFRPPEPFKIRNDEGEIRVEVVFDVDAAEIRLIVEEIKDFEIGDVLVPALTKRETEVMFRLCQGKADSDIARLCDVSVRTVQKHVENILVKLGVETRSAAVATVYQQIR